MATTSFLLTGRHTAEECKFKFNQGLIALWKTHYTKWSLTANGQTRSHLVFHSFTDQFHSQWKVGERALRQLDYWPTESSWIHQKQGLVEIQLGKRLWRIATKGSKTISNSAIFKTKQLHFPNRRDLFIADKFIYLKNIKLSGTPDPSNLGLSTLTGNGSVSFQAGIFLSLLWKCWELDLRPYACIADTLPT